MQRLKGYGPAMCVCRLSCSTTTDQLLLVFVPPVLSLWNTSVDTHKKVHSPISQLPTTFSDDEPCNGRQKHYFNTFSPITILEMGFSERLEKKLKEVDSFIYVMNITNVER